MIQPIVYDINGDIGMSVKRIITLVIYLVNTVRLIKQFTFHNYGTATLLIAYLGTYEVHW